LENKTAVSEFDFAAWDFILAIYKSSWNKLLLTIYLKVNRKIFPGFPHPFLLGQAKVSWLSQSSLRKI